MRDQKPCLFSDILFSASFHKIYKVLKNIYLLWQLIDAIPSQIDFLQSACRLCTIVCGGREHATFTIGQIEAKTVTSDDTAAAASHQIVATIKFGINPAFAGTGG